MQISLSILLKDTSAATGQAGIRTHMMTISELESKALDHGKFLQMQEWQVEYSTDML